MDIYLAQVLVRQSRHSFLFYATGRRFCQGMTATIELRRRQDLLSMAWYRFAPRDDYIDIEIVMNDTCMPPMVGTPPSGRLSSTEETR